jgi:hypothetical protein
MFLFLFDYHKPLNASVDIFSHFVFQFSLVTIVRARWFRPPCFEYLFRVRMLLECVLNLRSLL